MQREFPPHPYSALFPFRSGSSLIELSDSIAEKGQKEPIVLYEKQILDGRRRQAAAIRAGKAPIYRDFGSRKEDGDSALEFSFAVNFHRRDDMSESEKVLAAVGYAKFKRGDNQHTGKSSDAANAGASKPASQKEAAKKFGVSDAAVERAKKVMEHGTPELQEAMKAEVISVSDAASIASEPAEVQRQAVEMVKAGEATTAAGAVKAAKGNVEDPLKICKDIDAIVARLALVQTDKTAAKELASKGLVAARAIVAKL